jgi:hypothetical protein
MEEHSSAILPQVTGDDPRILLDPALSKNGHANLLDWAQ